MNSTKEISESMTDPRVATAKAKHDAPPESPAETLNSPIRRSPTIGRLVAALASAQGELKNVDRTAQGVHHKYPELCNVTDEVSPILSKYHVLYYQAVTSEGRHVCITTLLAHESGEFLESDTVLTVADDAVWEQCGGFTYGRRYALLAALGLAPEDDDGATAQGAQRDMRKDDIVTRAPAPDDGQLRVVDVRSKSGTKNGKPWTSYTVEFSDGGAYSTFAEDLASRCRQYVESGAVVTRETEQKGKYVNLLGCTPVDPPLYTLEKVQAKDSEGGGPWRIYVQGDDAVYITTDAMTADNATGAIEAGAQVTFAWTERQLGAKTVREVESLKEVPF